MKSLNLHPGENLLFTYRQTELVLAKPFFIIGLAIVVPWFFIIKYDLVSELGRIVTFLDIVALVVGLRYWLMWYLKEYVITSERLVHISHYGLFKKRVAETPLQRILNVSYKTTGLISSIFHYGDVEVQVVGLLEPIVLNHITQPSKIKDYLWELHGKYQSADSFLNAESIPKIEENIGYEKPYKT